MRVALGWVVVVVVSVLLSSPSAFGQANGIAASVLNAQPQQMQMASHDARAAQRSMASERSLLESSTYTYEHGERPLWEFAPSNTESLGDAARRLRDQHAVAKKSAVVYIN